MLDNQTYRYFEAFARATLPSWRLEMINVPHIFKQQGLPNNLNSILELYCLLDTMQENRFEAYQREIGGLTTEDEALFFNALKDYVKFVRAVFNREKMEIPYSTMMAHYAIYRKLLGYKPDFESVLEIGPGCGYLSFFLAQHKGLKSYYQIESADSFYVLQSQINTFLFRDLHKEHAIFTADHAASIPTLANDAEWIEISQTSIQIKNPALCHHIPWWKIGAVPENAFDLVTSNANISEFSDQAFKQYMLLIKKALKADGALVIQCIGGGPVPIDRMVSYMLHLGFGLVNLFPKAAKFADGSETSFPVVNAVFVKSTHPQYGQVILPHPVDVVTTDFVNRMYKMNAGGKHLTREEINAALQSEFN